MLAIKRILVPFDWSESSKHAFQMAVSLAQQHDAQLIVLHVVCLPALMYGPPSESYLDHWRDELCRLNPGDPKLRVQFQLAEGDPGMAILRTAREVNCDLIVMGTHGRTGLNRVLMGSVAEKVVRQATCLVLTVKCPVQESREIAEAVKTRPVLAE